VRVTESEADKIADHLDIPVAEFIEQYTDITPDRRGLTIISKEDDSCFFMAENPARCLINDVKPTQCSGFPNTWNFPNWQETCEATLVEERDFESAAKLRDSHFPTTS
jgi:Fe-S-cluster containining protein